MLAETYHQTPRHVVVPVEESTRFDSPLTIKWSFHNRTMKPITIGQRSGFKFELPSMPWPGKDQELILRVEYQIHAVVKNNWAATLNAATCLTEEMKVIHKAFNCAYSENQYGGLDFVVEYPISIEALQDRGGTVYLRELDLVISLENPQVCLPHPYSEEGILQHIREVDEFDQDPDSFRFKIRIIDNQDFFGSRYINIQNRIYWVKADKDFTRRDGVYVIRNKEITKEGGKMVQKLIEYYRFDEAQSELGLYLTFEEAEALGDLETHRKSKLAQLEHENSLTKKELEALKQKYQIAQTERENEKEELASLRSKEDHRRTLEREQIKDHYEDRSYQRKDHSEGLKMIPTIMVGLGALLMGIKAIFF